MRTRIFSAAAAFLFVFASFAQAQTQPATSDAEHRLGLGAYLPDISGGLAPSVTYDSSERTTVVGTLGLYSGATAVSGELRYRFPQPSYPNEKVEIEPYVSGGLMRVNVSYGFRPWTYSENYNGWVASVGTFMKIKKYPRWRLDGGIGVAHVGGDDVSVNGFGLDLGAHYMF